MNFILVLLYICVSVYLLFLLIYFVTSLFSSDKNTPSSKQTTQDHQPPQKKQYPSRYMSKYDQLYEEIKKEHYHLYSVKEDLIAFFGSDPITEMRKREDTWQYDDVGFRNTRPYVWLHTDREMCRMIQQNFSLTDTELHDDYIAYLTTINSKNKVYLVFVFSADSLDSRIKPFNIDPEYAYSLKEKWAARDYEAVIVGISVGFSRNSTKQFRVHLKPCYGRTFRFLMPIKQEGQCFLAEERSLLFSDIQRRFFDAICSDNQEQYQYLLSDEAVLMRPVRNDDEKPDILAKGIEAIAQYFRELPKPIIRVINGGVSNVDPIEIVIGEHFYALQLNKNNIIHQIVMDRFSKFHNFPELSHDTLPKSPLPELIHIRPLNVKEAHAYGVQASFSNGAVKNYYLKAITSLELPPYIHINHHVFDEKVLRSVKCIENASQNGIVFSNDYYISREVLYYQGFLQQIPQKINEHIYKTDTIALHALYRIPICSNIHHGLLSEDETPISDFSAVSFNGGPEIYTVESESSHKIGYLKKNGEWLIPPIFDHGETLYPNACTVASKESQHFLVSATGLITPLLHNLNSYLYVNGRCPYNIGEPIAAITYPSEEYFEDLIPGCWGYLDENGNTIIEPQYVFATSFDYNNGQSAFVAKFINEDAKWGLIDRTGKEIVPCQYVELSTHNDTAVCFRRHHGEPCGLMDFDGNIILEPCYEYFLDYTPVHRLAAGGNSWDKCGVFSVDSGKTIVPFIFEYVFFEDDHIECEGFTEEDGHILRNYYYDGTLKENIDFIIAASKNDVYVKQKNDKYGAEDENGNILVPYIFEKLNFVEFYRQGFHVYRNQNSFGVKSTTGSIILPPKYKDITITEDFIIGTTSVYTQELYDRKGTRIFSDPCNMIHINKNRLSRETAFGKEVYAITHSFSAENLCVSQKESREKP